MELIPEDLREEFKPYYRPTNTIARYVKAADKFSALIKCREELSLGNKEFEAAAKSSEKAIRQMELPAAEVFLKEFIPSFESALDESI